MTSRTPWLVLLALAGRVVAQLPTPTLVARQTNSPILVFNGVNQPTACASMLISWIYAGPDNPLSLFITNIGVAQTGPSTQTPTKTFTNTSNKRSLQRRDDINITVASTLAPASSPFNWTVTVPQGNYQFTAIIQGVPAYSTTSSPFFVQQGGDTSCLNLPPSSSTSSPLPSNTSTSSPTNGSTSSTSPSVTPIGGSSSTPINKGAIAGGVVAGAVILFGAIGLYIFFVCRPRSRSHSRNLPDPLSHSPKKNAFGFGGGGGVGGWGGLSSVDSHMAMNDTPFTATPKKSQRPYVTARHHSQSESVGPIVGGVGASQEDIQSYLAGTRSRSGSAAQHYGYPSPSEEKFGTPEEVVLATLPSSGNPQRRPSLTAYTQSKPGRSSIDSTGDSPQGLVRTSSTGGASQPQRKTPRKPVPMYRDSSAPTPSPATASPFDSPIVPPTPAFANGQGQGHYATRAERESLKSTASNSKSKSKTRSKSKGKSEGGSTNASSEELAAPPAQTLVHKSSFGPGGVEGKPLHYLIPDMPVARR